VKIAIYARVSTDKQENGNQVDQLRDFAAKQGWEIVEEFVDAVTGSGKSKRPQFEKMMLAASQRQFELLLFWKLDRLSREGVRKTLTYLEELDAWGVAWRSFMEPYLDSCGVMKELVVSVMALMAQQERIAISDRTKAGLARAVRQGKTLGRRAVVVDVPRARKMQRDGLGLRPIAKKMGISVNTLQNALRA
jgi:DNA invertase Pin-like site-specific DNA recombinase